MTRRPESGIEKNQGAEREETMRNVNCGLSRETTQAVQQGAEDIERQPNSQIESQKNQHPASLMNQLGRHFCKT